MKRIPILLLAAVLLLTACSPKHTGGQYQTITPQDAKGLLDSGAALTLVDVRTAEEYAEGHIPSAVNIPNEDIQALTTAPDEHTDGTIIVYCRSGRRSREAAEKLLSLGYTDVQDLGGILDWPYQTISGPHPGAWNSLP